MQGINDYLILQSEYVPTAISLGRCRQEISLTYRILKQDQNDFLISAKTTCKRFCLNLLL
jgi:hypothetical protein